MIFKADVSYTMLEKSIIPGYFRVTNMPNMPPVMFLVFISNLPEKFRKINCEIQQFPLKKEQTYF